MSQQEFAEKILEVAQELWEYRDGGKKDEELREDSVWPRLDILKDELANW